MERAEIRRRALLAAATVTLAFACQADTSKGEVIPAVDDTDALTTTETTAPDPVETAETDAAAPPDTTETADTVETAETADSAAANLAPDCAALKLDLQACCDALRAWCGPQFAEGTPAFDDCVFGPNFNGSTGCIPWGPPVPPALA